MYCWCAWPHAISARQHSATTFVLGNGRRLFCFSATLEHNDLMSAKSQRIAGKH
jgi:hypothetical protein